MLQEDYLHCSEYEGHAKHPLAEGFSAFQNEESKLFFFAMLDADDKVLMKSEGYPQVSARENGINSVIKNRVNEEFYSLKEENGRYYLSLRAANYKEIARSCDCDSAAAAWALLPFLTTKAIRKNGVALSSEENESGRIEDDYLRCDEYRGHLYSPNFDPREGFHVFRAERTGLYYFAIVDDEHGEVLLRSEGYPTQAARDNGLQSVFKNRELPERYSIKRFPSGQYYVSLKAGNHQEIARSCPKDSESALWALFPFLDPDYVATTTTTDSGAVALGALGLGAAALATELPAPEVEVPATPIITVEETATVNTDWVAPVAATTLGAAAANSFAGGDTMMTNNVKEDTEAAGGFPWWLWLLLGLLALGLLFWWLKGCGEKATQTIDTASATALGVVDSARIKDSLALLEKSTATTTATEGGGTVTGNVTRLTSILFDFNSASLRGESKAELDKLVTVLNQNPTHRALLRAFTDSKGTAEYNERLSRNRAKAAQDYLISKGIPLDRIKTAALGKSEPIAKNSVAGGKDTEAGRQLNRRVELNVVSEKGKILKEYVEPIAVPDSLKK